jgi:hypothetical protein
VAIVHIVVLSSALVTLFAVTAVRRADDQVRRRSWSRRCPEEIRALRDLDRALRSTDPAPATDASIDQLADDLRRLYRQRRADPDHQSQLWLEMVDRAYDERLCLACRCLGLAEYLEPLQGMDRDLERVRVENELQAAGLTLGP